MSFFNNLGLKIAGFFALVAGFFMMKSKFQENKIEKLEVKDRVNDKQNERREKQEKIIEEVFANEKESIDKKVKDKPVSNSDDYLDGL